MAPDAIVLVVEIIYHCRWVSACLLLTEYNTVYFLLQICII